MNCGEVRELLSRQLDGALDDEREVAIAGHLSECSECSAWRAEIHRVSVLLDAVAAPLRSDSEAILEALPGRRPGTETVPIRRSRRALWSLLGAAATLAVVFAVAVHFGVIRLPGSGPDVPALPKSAPTTSRDPIDAVQCLLAALGHERPFHELYVLSGNAFASPGRLADPDVSGPPPDVVVAAARAAGVDGEWINGTFDAVSTTIRPIVDDDRPVLLAMGVGDGRSFRLVVRIRSDEWYVHDARESGGFAWRDLTDGWEGTPTGRLRPLDNPAFLPDPPRAAPDPARAVADAFNAARGAASDARSAFRVGYAALIDRSRPASSGPSAEEAVADALRNVAYDRRIAADFLRRAADDPSTWGVADVSRWRALADRFEAVAEIAEEIEVMGPGPAAATRAEELRDADLAVIRDLP